MLTHLFIVFTRLCLRSWLPGPSSWALNAWFSALESHSKLTTSFVFSSGLPDFRGHSSLCGLRAKIDNGIYRPYGATTHGEPHTHPYRYVCTLMPIVVPPGHWMPCIGLTKTDYGLGWMVSRSTILIKFYDQKQPIRTYPAKILMTNP